MQKTNNAGIQRIRELQSVYTIYYVDSGSTDGGAAAVVTTGDPLTPTIIKTIVQRGRANDDDSPIDRR